MEERIRAIPLVGEFTVRTFWRTLSYLRHPRRFPGSRAYWRQRYRRGGSSGAGSYGRLARFKAEIVNGFVAERSVRSVIEFGCGDGNQLGLADYPAYAGFDISRRAVACCRRSFRHDATKRFALMRRYTGQRAELALSLDVVYHLVEDATYDAYMRTLFGAADRFVIIYSSNHDDNRGFEGTHVRHRRFTRWVEENAPDWRLIRHVPNRFPYAGNPRTGSFAHFFVFERTADAAAEPAGPRTRRRAAGQLPPPVAGHGRLRTGRAAPS